MGSEAPECFGEQWDQNAPECAGGRDPNWRSADGSHIRDRCNFYTSCGSRFQAKKEDEHRRLIPASSLFAPRIEPPQIRPSFTLPTTQPSVPPEVQQLRSQLAQANSLLQQHQAYQQRQAYNPQMYGSPPPLQMMAMDMSVPKYLSAPEPTNTCQPIWLSLARMVLRAILKAVGHTVANFADQTPLDRSHEEHKNKPQ